MKIKLRDHLKTITYLVLILAAVSSGVLWWQEQETNTVKKFNKPPILTMQKVTMTRFASNGLAQYHIDSPHIRYDLDRKETHFQQPKINFSEPGKPAWQLRADKGQADAHFHHVLLKENVLLTQTDSQLQADRLALTMNQARELQSAVAEGSPVKFTRQDPKGKAPMIATADKMIYAGKLITLIGHAVVTQGENHLSSTRIIYDTSRKVVLTAPAAGEETTIIVNPNQDNQKQ